MEKGVTSPRLGISAGLDGDGIPDDEDNCPDDYNPYQGDTYPQEAMVSAILVIVKVISIVM